MQINRKWKEIIIIIIEKKIGIYSLSGEKKSGENTDRKKGSRGKTSLGKNLVTCKKFSYFSPTFFSSIRYSLRTNTSYRLPGNSLSSYRLNFGNKQCDTHFQIQYSPRFTPLNFSSFDNLQQMLQVFLCWLRAAPLSNLIRLEFLKVVFSGRDQVFSTAYSMCQSLFLRGLRPATLLKKRLSHSLFPVNFVKFLWTPFSIEHL